MCILCKFHVRVAGHWIFIETYSCINFFLKFKVKRHSLLGVYINIYIERESIQQEINFICKSFRQRLYQLHIYNKILIQSSNLQIVFLQILIFHYYRNSNTNIKKKIYEKIIATKLRETILTITNHNLHKSNWLKKRELRYMTIVKNATQK